jgi:hypothetical protein
MLFFSLLLKSCVKHLCEILFILFCSFFLLCHPCKTKSKKKSGVKIIKNIDALNTITAMTFHLNYSFARHNFQIKKKAHLIVVIVEEKRWEASLQKS